MDMGFTNTRRYIYIALILILLVSVVPYRAESFNISMLPSPFSENYEAGRLYEKGDYRFAFNNGYLIFFKAHSNEINVFAWDNGWKLHNRIDHVIADAIGFVKSPVKFIQDNTLKITPQRSQLTHEEFYAVFQEGFIPVKGVVLKYFAKVKIIKVFISSMAFPMNIKDFVPNKVPDAQFSFYINPFSHSCRIKVCRNFYLYKSNLRRYL